MAGAQNVTGLNMFYKTTAEEILSKCKTFADVKCAKKAESFTSFIGPRISRRQKKKEFGGGGGGRTAIAECRCCCCCCAPQVVGLAAKLASSTCMKARREKSKSFKFHQEMTIKGELAYGTSAQRIPNSKLNSEQ